MSSVTSILLVAPSEGRWKPVQKNIEAVNGWLSSHGHSIGQFRKADVDSHSPKAFEGVVYSGAFNYLDTKELVDEVAKQEWEQPEETFLLIRGSCDGFCIIKVGDLRKP